MINRRKYQQPTKIFWKLILGGIIIVTAISVYFYNQYQYFIYTPVNSQNTQDISFIIKKGDNTKQIADLLVQKKLILSPDSFKLYTKLNNLDKNFKTGRFTLNQSLNTPEIIKILSSEQNRQEIVTIPEGSTTEDIDKILSNQQLTTAGEFNKAVQNFNSYSKYSFLDPIEQKKLTYPLEGYLYPDTYFVNQTNYSNDSMISLLLNTFEQKAIPVTKNSKRSLSEIVNVAAMVEKEANKNIDRPIIAGIIWKRLDEKWQLGIDATLLYLQKDREITYEDLQKDHGYNTRIRTGLPLGPIANPGLASLKAAASPEETPYYYYLTSKDGQMIYAKTNAEHVNNKNKYL